MGPSTEACGCQVKPVNGKWLGVHGWWLRVIREDNLVAEQSPVVGVEKQELKLPSGKHTKSY